MRSRKHAAKVIFYASQQALYWNISRKAVKSPEPAYAVSRRRPARGRSTGSSKAEKCPITVDSGKTVFRYDVTPTYCATLISTRRSAASKRRLRRCGFVRVGGWLPCFTFPHFSFSSFFLQVFLTPSLTNDASAGGLCGRIHG